MRSRALHTRSAGVRCPYSRRPTHLLPTHGPSDSALFSTDRARALVETQASRIAQSRGRDAAARYVFGGHHGSESLGRCTTLGLIAERRGVLSHICTRKSGFFRLVRLYPRYNIIQAWRSAQRGRVLLKLGGDSTSVHYGSVAPGFKVDPSLLSKVFEESSKQSGMFPFSRY